jgi:heptosyltransferase-2
LAAAAGHQVNPIAPRGSGRGIVVFAAPALGDFVRCHSVIRILAERFPDSPIDIVARQPAIEMAAFMPEVRTGIPEVFRHRSIDLAARFALAGKLRRGNYKSAYLLQNSFKSALVPFLSRIPKRVGWATEFRFGLLTQRYFGMHRLPRMIERVCWIAVEGDASAYQQWPEPRLRVPESHRAEFTALRDEARTKTPVITLAPSSTDPDKNWSVENFAAVARHFAGRGATVWIVGSPQERPLAAAIAQGAGVAGVEDRTCQSVTTMALTIAASDVFIGNDSGPLHIAGGFGKPSVGVFGLTDPLINAPINVSVRIGAPARALVRQNWNDVHWPTVDMIKHQLERALEAARAAEQTTGGAL